MSLPVTAADGSVVGAAEVTYSLDEVQAILSRLNTTSLLVAAGAVLVAVLAGFLLATSVARPAGQVAEAALALADRRPTGLPFGPQSANPFPGAAARAARQHRRDPFAGPGVQQPGGSAAGSRAGAARIRVGRLT